jgi:K+-sensing histidine kinase KdpD
VNDLAGISHDERTMQRSAMVINDALLQLEGDLESWERHELLDTITMHAGALRVAADRSR